MLGTNHAVINRVAGANAWEIAHYVTFVASHFCRREATQNAHKARCNQNVFIDVTTIFPSLHKTALSRVFKATLFGRHNIYYRTLSRSAMGCLICLADLPCRRGAHGECIAANTVRRFVTFKQRSLIDVYCELHACRCSSLLAPIESYLEQHLKFRPGARVGSFGRCQSFILVDQYRQKWRGAQWPCAV